MTCETLDITGGVKFFKGNKALYRDGNRAGATTNDDSAKNILSSNKYIRWESLLSNDLTTETITISFKNTVVLDRLLLLTHNFKKYTVKYNGGTDFANVSGLNGDLAGGIAELSYSNNTSYYKFDSVSVDSIIITVDTTQIADEEKQLNQFVATEEIGTFAGFPVVQKVAHSRNIRGAKSISGRNVIQKSYETTSFSIKMKTYPVQADVDIFDYLHDSEESFLVWLCGGRFGSDHFRVEQRGWRLHDLYNMQINRPLNSNYEKGIYQNGVNKTVSFVEVI